MLFGPCFPAHFYERPFLGASGFQGLGFGVSGCDLTFFISWVPGDSGEFPWTAQVF